MVTSLQFVEKTNTTFLERYKPIKPILSNKIQYVSHNLFTLLYIYGLKKTGYKGKARNI